MSDFKFACPECGQHISGDESYRGLQVQCPHCQRTFVVPAEEPSRPPRPRPPLVLTPNQTAAPRRSHMKLIGHAVVVLSFLVGWIGVGAVVSHCMFNLGLMGTSERHVLTDWISGSLLGLPAGIFLAYVMSGGFKGDGWK